MEDYRFSILLFLAAFAVQHTLGGRNGAVTHQIVKVYGESAQRTLERRSEHDAVLNDRPQLVDIATGSSHQNMHPDLYEQREIHSSQDGSSLNYDHRSNVMSELDAVIDTSMDFSVHGSNEQQHVDEGLTDTGIVVDLIDGFGVYINKKKLISYTNLYKHDPRKLMEALLGEMIDPHAIATEGITLIPEKVLYVIEIFINRLIGHKMTRSEFGTALNEYISKLKSQYINNGQEAVAGPSHHEASELPLESRSNVDQEQPHSSSQSAGQSIMVELTPKSKVYINKQMLELLTKMYKHQSGVLLRRLFDEIMDPRELATMQTTDNIVYKSIPKHINLAIKEYLEKVSGTEMTHSDFLCAVNNYIAYLRHKYGVEKQKLTNEEMDTSSGSSIPLPERYPFQTNPDLLKKLVEQNKNNPQMLIKKILLEMIPSSEIRTMKLTATEGYKKIPIDILNSIKVFINDVTESKITPVEITRMVGISLSRARANEKKRKH